MREHELQKFPSIFCINFNSDVLLSFSDRKGIMQARSYERYIKRNWEWVVANRARRKEYVWGKMECQAVNIKTPAEKKAAFSHYDKVRSFGLQIRAFTQILVWSLESFSMTPLTTFSSMLGALQVINIYSWDAWLSAV